VPLREVDLVVINRKILIYLRKTFLFPEEIACRMKSFIVSIPPTIIMTFVLSTGGMQFESAETIFVQAISQTERFNGIFQSAYGQATDSAFANCVIISGGYTVDVIMLGTDEDCNDEQFTQAVNHYKAHGYIERQYSDMFGEKMMSLYK
jgi:hypothetical protein